MQHVCINNLRGSNYLQSIHSSFKSTNCTWSWTKNDLEESELPVNILFAESHIVEMKIVESKIIEMLIDKKFGC